MNLAHLGNPKRLARCECSELGGEARKVSLKRQPEKLGLDSKFKAKS